MWLAELSERSGVNTATIKYYLREGLLQPGRRISATQAEYGESHLRRLRLVRALIQIGRVPVAAAREVIIAAEDESLDHHQRLGAVTMALPPRSEEPAEDDPAVEVARGSVEGLLEHLGWSSESGLSMLNPDHRRLIDSVAALVRLGYPCDIEQLLPYGHLAAQLAVTDLDMVEAQPTEAEQVEAAVALTVLYEPVLLSLRRMAHAEESARRF
ncbi:MerR family transcriptional regulator [Streptomyces sp. AC512_CC834]|uniref:MerR family transcriptional regulator n=1 Tax=Streptomyces sp. AC512_CC834 TaxID=2823691 RepID=UPI001C252999|nr:MerR family transcriptional regulator [Streptomyces sp. AC512_CC834]